MFNLKMNKRGVTTAYYVLIGVVIAVLVFVPILKGAATLLSGKDKSLASFNKLADKIDALSVNGGTSGSTEAVLIHLEDNELIMFFDQDENISLRMMLSSYDLKDSTSDYLKYNYPFYAEDDVFSEIMSAQADFRTANSPFLVFNKPTSCQKNSCMVLCGGFDLFSPDDVGGYLASGLPSIKGSENIFLKKNFIVVSCSKIKSTKTFPNIKKFYRKPNFYNFDWPKEIKEETPTFIQNLFKSSSYFKNFYLHGSILYFCSDRFSLKDAGDVRDGHNNIISNVKLDYCPFKQNQYAELSDDNKLQVYHQLKDHYVYFENYGDKMFMCYESPCASLEAKLDTRWQKSLDICTGTNSCSSLLAAIDMYSDTSKLAFSVKDNKLIIQHGDYTLLFNNELNMYVKRLYGDEGSELITQALLEKVDAGQGPMLKLEANSIKYWLFDIGSLAGDTASNVKPELIFKVKEWVFDNN